MRTGAPLTRPPGSPYLPGSASSQSSIRSSTLYFEIDAGDGFRESGFSKERRLEPQITIGLLTGADGFPLTVSAFEGNKPAVQLADLS
jgi:hypothetical protein